MFETASSIALDTLLKLFAGGVIGFTTAWLVLRSKLTLKASVRTAVVSSSLFILSFPFVGWARSHEAWLNGRRLDVAPWGENLRLKNRIADNEALICIGPPILAAGAIALAFRKRDLSTRTV
jgi:hypothetical protein